MSLLVPHARHPAALEHLGPRAPVHCVSPEDSRFFVRQQSDGLLTAPNRARNMKIDDLLRLRPVETGDSLETANTERCCPENLSLVFDAVEADEALYDAVRSQPLPT